MMGDSMMGNSMMGDSMMSGDWDLEAGMPMMIEEEDSCGCCCVCGIIIIVLLSMLSLVGILYATDCIQIPFMDELLGKTPEIPVKTENSDNMAKKSDAKKPNIKKDEKNIFRSMRSKNSLPRNLDRHQPIPGVPRGTLMEMFRLRALLMLDLAVRDGAPGHGEVSPVQLGGAGIRLRLEPVMLRLVWDLLTIKQRLSQTTSII